MCGGFIGSIFGGGNKDAQRKADEAAAQAKADADAKVAQAKKDADDRVALEKKQQNDKLLADKQALAESETSARERGKSLLGSIGDEEETELGKKKKTLLGG